MSIKKITVQEVNLIDLIFLSLFWVLVSMCDLNVIGEAFSVFLAFAYLILRRKKNDE